MSQEVKSLAVDVSQPAAGCRGCRFAGAAAVAGGCLAVGSREKEVGVKPNNEGRGAIMSGREKQLSREDSGLRRRIRSVQEDQSLPASGRPQKDVSEPRSHQGPADRPGMGCLAEGGTGSGATPAISTHSRLYAQVQFGEMRFCFISVTNIRHQLEGLGNTCCLGHYFYKAHCCRANKAILKPLQIVNQQCSHLAS